MARSRQQATPQQIDVLVRRSKAVALRKSGLNYRMVAAQIVQEYGEDNLPKNYDSRYAWADIQEALLEIRTTLNEDVETLRGLELDRLDDLYQLAYKAARKGQLGGIDRALRVMERRARLKGLDLPIKVAQTDDKGDPLPEKTDDQLVERMMILMALADRRREDGVVPSEELDA
jgi:hypothetical protein